MNYNDLSDEVREALMECCTNKCLDDEEDFEEVMATIGIVIARWLESRCEGCR